MRHAVRGEPALGAMLTIFCPLSCATAIDRSSWHQFIRVAGVGKSSILLRFTDDVFDDVAPTIGVDFKVKALEVDGRRVKITAWDTGTLVLSGSHLQRVGCGCPLFCGITAEWFDVGHSSSSLADCSRSAF